MGKDIDEKIERYLDKSIEDLDLLTEGFIRDLLKFGTKRAIITIEDILDKVVGKLSTETGDSVVDNRLERLRKDALFHRQRFLDIMKRMQALNPELG